MLGTKLNPTGGGESNRRERVVAQADLRDDLDELKSSQASPFFGSRLLHGIGTFRSVIGFRLLVAVLLFSSIVTLTLTALQLYLDYDREVGAIETRLDEIGRSYLASLGESLWNLDENQLKLQLDGIMRLPDIRAADISEIADRPGPIHIVVGARAGRSVITRDYPLDYVVHDSRHQIGVLHVEATLTEVYRQLVTRALVILASQAAKTFLVSLFILYMVDLLVTRHLVAIAGFVGHYNLPRLPPPLRLSRAAPHHADELDKVVDAFNRMCASLQRAYGDLSRANEKLERDLKVRQGAEADARRSEQRFRDYAETASDWFWETGPDHVFTYISEPLDAFGMDRSELIGRRRGDFASDRESEPEKWRAHMATLERREPFRKFEYARRDTSGRLRHVSVSGRPMFDSDGRFLGYRGSATDLTKHHDAEERLRQSQRMDAIGQLTGGVAHDFNNVLTVITGTIEILQEGLSDRPQLAAIAQLIDDAATRGAEITSQLLTYARRQPLEPREVDVNDLMNETAKLLRPILGEHVDIRLKLADDAWSALADPSQLSTAIVNLAVNARDAMKDGGTLTLETANVTLDEADPAGYGETKPGAFVMIAVSDTGVGIPADIRDRVFEPFFTTKGVGRGTGLGLSMVYGFVRQTGGMVKLESEEGRGTVVRLYLPRAAGQVISKPELVQTAVQPGGRETILVVEDDALVRGYVVAQLGSLGYTTLVAGDGAAALAIVDQGAAFDLLFTDMIMPGGMNGSELAEAVRKRRPDVKVLYTSGYSDDAFMHDGHLDAGIALLTKPYRKQDLSRKIREVLDGGPQSSTERTKA